MISEKDILFIMFRNLEQVGMRKELFNIKLTFRI